jgi:hypothetical protein
VFGCQRKGTKDETTKRKKDSWWCLLPRKMRNGRMAVDDEDDMCSD